MMFLTEQDLMNLFNWPPQNSKDCCVCSELSRNNNASVHFSSGFLSFVFRGGPSQEPAHQRRDPQQFRGILDGGAWKGPDVSSRMEVFDF